jgi:hypothetical protein
MKRYIKAFAFAAVILSLFSCAKESASTPEAGNIELRTIIASFQGSDSGAKEWELRDQISLLHANHNFVLTGKGTGTETEFSGNAAQLPLGEKYIAVYPYNENYRLDNGSFLINLPQNPDLIDGTFSQVIGTGIVTGNQVSLQHATAYLGFEITRDDITKIVISSKGKQLAGTFMATINGNGTAELTSVAGQTYKELVINRCIKGQYYIPVPAERYNKLSIAFTSPLGSFESEIEKPHNLTVGQTAQLGAIDAELVWKRPEQPSIKILDKTSSTVSVSWSVSNFSSPAIDLQHDWSAGVYRDAACSDLVVSWDIPADTFICPESTIYNIEGPYCPRFIFTGLDADTEYYVKAWKTDSPEDVSETLAVKTLVSNNVMLTSGYAQSGEVILAEDFSELIWGGDVVGRCTGYTDDNRYSATGLNRAYGINPVGYHTINGFQHKFSLVNPTNCVGLFNNLTKAIGTTRLAEWSSIAEDKTGGKVLACPGYVKLGASDKEGGIVTPVLSAIEGVATVRVSFKAAPYRGMSTDRTKLHVKAITSNTIDTATGTITDYTEGALHEFVLSEKNEWVEFSCDLEVKGTERIAIYSKRNGATTGQCRVHIDDIKIEIL